MALFKKGNSTLKLEGLISMSERVTPSYEESRSFDLSTAQFILDAVAGPNYTNGNPFKATETSNSSTNLGSPKVEDDGWAIDIAQSHHFTIEIKDAPGHTSKSGNLLSYRTPNRVYSNFLPVKNMSLTYSSYENMNIPVSIFGDFPLLLRRRVETINLVCYDEDTHELEHNLHLWSNECFPMGKYVAYMDDVVKELIYRGYTVDGRESLYIRRFVIPTGQINVSRDYSENEAKMISFSLACVGDGSTCATGSPSLTAQMSSGTFDAPPSNVTTPKSSGGIVELNGPEYVIGSKGIEPNPDRSWVPIGNDTPLSQPPVQSVQPKSSGHTTPPTIKKRDSFLGRTIGLGKMFARDLFLGG